MQLTIGKFIFNTKTIGLITFAFFCIGIALGINIAAYEKSNGESMPIILSAGIVISTILTLYKPIKKEIKTARA